MNFARGSLLALVVSCLGLAVPACTLVLDAETDQCNTDADCLGRGPGFAGNVCEPTRKVCVLSSTYCETNAQCIDSNGAENFICDKTEHVCKNLFSNECTRLLADRGDLRNDDAIIFGLPWASNSFEPFKAGEDAVELSRRDLKAAAGGIPSAVAGGAPRPLVWLVCDYPDPRVPLRDLFNRHADVMFDRLGLQLTIGWLTADIVQDQVNRGTPKGSLLFSNVAQFPSFLNVPGARGLVYSFYPSLDVLTRAFARTAELAETKLRAEGVTRDIRVMAALQASPVTQRSLTVLRESLHFNGKTADANGSNFQFVSLGNLGEGTTGPQVAKAVGEVEAFDPDIILCPTISDCDGLSRAYEPTKPGRTFWIVNESMFNTDAYVKSDAQQKRFLVVFAGKLRDSENMKQIRTYFGLTFPDDFLPSPFVGLYHFGFLSAVLASGVKEGPVTGRAMGEILQNQVTKDGQVIFSGLDGYQPAFDAVRAGRKVSLVDHIQFDQDGQGLFDELEIVCPQPKTFVVQSSGLDYLPPTDRLGGTFACGY